MAPLLAAAASGRRFDRLAARLQPGQLGRVEVVLAAGGAAVHGQAQVLLRLLGVAELPVGDAEPEVELVVVVGPRDLAAPEPDKDLP